MYLVQKEKLQKLVENGTKYHPPPGMGGETEPYHVAVDDLKRQLKRKYPWLGHEVNMWSTALRLWLRRNLHRLK